MKEEVREYTFYGCNCDFKGEYLKALIPVEMIERKIYKYP
jgi:hypothetical protein